MKFIFIILIASGLSLIILGNDMLGGKREVRIAFSEATSQVLDLENRDPVRMAAYESLREEILSEIPNYSVFGWAILGLSSLGLALSCRKEDRTRQKIDSEPVAVVNASAAAGTFENHLHD